MTTRTKAILSLSGVFVLGAICGATVIGLFVQEKVREVEQLKVKKGLVEFFSDQLRLTEVQRDSLDEALAQASEELMMLRRAAVDEYREVFDSLRQRIEPILTAEQRERMGQLERRLLQRELREKREEPSPHRKIPPAEQPKGGPFPGDSALPPVQNIPTPAPKSSQSVKPADGRITHSADSSNQGTDDAGSNDGDITKRVQQLYADIVNTYKTRLGLSEEQTGQVRRIVGESLRRAARIREEWKDAAPVRMLKLQKLNFRKMHERIYADILTQQQQEQYPEIPREVFKLIKQFIEEQRAASRR